MQIALAPMEGLVDDVMREILTAIGGVDWCVTEFIRVTDTLLPLRTFHRLGSELQQGAQTQSGVPVRVQLLGSEPEWLALNAARAADLGAPAIDLNFGCPAKTVNRHRGGAVLLQEPQTLFDIVCAVRAAVPAAIPVTAKMRLGYEDTELTLDCARALEQGGAAQLVVHARTKTDGYRPPAYWEWIARIKQQVSVPVIANGEIWTAADYLQCRAESGCDDVMLGRGLIACPDLAWQIRALVDGVERQPMTWAQMLPWLNVFFRAVNAKTVSQHAPGRLKQWLMYLRRSYPEAGELHQLLRRENRVPEVAAMLEQQCQQQGQAA
ncbi:MAG: tRNA dihydrouridine(16) synthase DusC [Neisseriaceae bacterium]|nr:tRNA-dihydrouridine synthase [Pseudomonadota bacterium]RTL03326.1 MAG: tRNA dihydrouridine(16) synthase DusC [Neisseriaceae bacterium]